MIESQPNDLDYARALRVYEMVLANWRANRASIDFGWVVRALAQLENSAHRLEDGRRRTHALEEVVAERERLEAIAPFARASWGAA